jgi:hypothetical protein
MTTCCAQRLARGWAACCQRDSAARAAPAAEAAASGIRATRSEPDRDEHRTAEPPGVRRRPRTRAAGLRPHGSAGIACGDQARRFGLQDRTGRRGVDRRNPRGSPQHRRGVPDRARRGRADRARDTRSRHARRRRPDRGAAARGGRSADRDHRRRRGARAGSKSPSILPARRTARCSSRAATAARGSLRIRPSSNARRGPEV